MLCEKGDIGRIDNLRVLDAPPPIAIEFFGHLVDGGKRLCIRGIADRMDRNLKIADGSAYQRVAELGLGHQRKTGVPRIVRIGGLKPGSARSQSTIQIEFDAIKAQLVVVKPPGRAGARDEIHRIRPGGISHDAHGQPALVTGTAEGLPILDRGPHVGNGSDAVAIEDLLSLAERKVAFGGARGRYGLGNKLGRAVDKHAGRDEGFADPFDPPARRIFDSRFDAGSLHCCAVCPAGMAIDPLQPDRPVADDGIQLGSGGESAQSPLLLIPTATQDPGPCGIVAREGGNLVQSLLQRCCVAEVQYQGRYAQPHHMHVGIDHPRDECATLPIQAIFYLRRSFVPAMKDLLHAAPVVDQECLEPVDVAFLVDPNAGDIVDELVGRGGGGGGKGDGRSGKQPVHVFHGPVD